MATFPLQYIKWQSLYEDEKPYEILRPKSEYSSANIPRSNLVFDTKHVVINNIRGEGRDFTLDDHGFQYLQHETKVTALKDKQCIVSQYIPEMEEMIRRVVPDADRVFCFNWRVC